MLLLKASEKSKNQPRSFQLCQQKPKLSSGTVPLKLAKMTMGAPLLRTLPLAELCAITIRTRVEHIFIRQNIKYSSFFSIRD
jgi:hypothetical protein